MLLWHPDSAWINGQSHKYRNNVRDWLFNFVNNNIMMESFSSIDKIEFENNMKIYFYPDIEKTGFSKGFGQVYSQHLRLSGYQCTFNNPQEHFSKIKKLFNLLSKTLGWKEPKFPSKYSFIKGKRNKPYFNYKKILEIYGSIDNFLATLKVFSYAIPYKEGMNYTTNISI
jgi:hypothetical protein